MSGLFDKAISLGYFQTQIAKKKHNPQKRRKKNSPGKLYDYVKGQLEKLLIHFHRITS